MVRVLARLMQSSRSVMVTRMVLKVCRGLLVMGVGVVFMLSQFPVKDILGKGRCRCR